jgi:hypothetical protein
MSNLPVKHSHRFSPAKLLNRRLALPAKDLRGRERGVGEIGKAFLVRLLGGELQNYRFRGEIFGDNPLIAINLR